MDLQVLQFGALQAVRGISSSYVMSAVPQEAQRASKTEFGTWTVKKKLQNSEMTTYQCGHKSRNTGQARLIGVGGGRVCGLSVEGTNPDC